MVYRRLILPLLVAAAAFLSSAGEGRAQCAGQPNANTVCAGPPSGGAGLPGFRTLVGADLPGAAITVNATPITGGTSGRIPFNNGGLYGEFVPGGDCTFSAPNFTCTKTSGNAFAPSATVDATNATNIASGSLANTRLTTGHVNAGTGLTGGALPGGGTVAADIATVAQFAAATANKLLAADKVFTAEVPVTYGTTTTFDFNTFINAAVTLTGNITTITFSNVKAGQAGVLRFIQDGTGSRTIPPTINTILKCAGACNYVLSTTASAVDAIGYTCVTATFCIGGALLKDIK
jgi:hypothetical protein